MSVTSRVLQAAVDSGGAVIKLIHITVCVNVYKYCMYTNSINHLLEFYYALE